MILQIGVKALIRNETDEYLFLKRSQVMGDESEPSWDIPGGRIEPTEALSDGLAREISEETGLKMSGRPELLAAQDIFVSQKDLHVVRLTYSVQSKNQSIRISDEHTDYCWANLVDAQGLNTEPYLKEVINTLVQKSTI